MSLFTRPISNCDGLILVMTTSVRRKLAAAGLTLGVHTSISGGLGKAIDRATDLGINALQIFSQNVRSWKSKTISRRVASTFRNKLHLSTVELGVIHSSYLLNLASPDSELRQKSIAGLEEEIYHAQQLGIPYVVTHIGAHTGSGKTSGLTRVIKSLNRFSRSERFSQSSATLLLENTAGAGTTLGQKFDELGWILSGLEQRERFGICFDTCHGYAGGYDISTPEGVHKTVDSLDRKVGVSELKLVHINDSKGGLGSQVDRHEHIGKGKIGHSGFSALINHPQLRGLPFILETPKEQLDGKNADQVNVNEVLKLIVG